MRSACGRRVERLGQRARTDATAGSGAGAARDHTHRSADPAGGDAAAGHATAGHAAAAVTSNATAVWIVVGLGTALVVASRLAMGWTAHGDESEGFDIR